MTMRDTLRKLAEDYKGLAALVGAFITGGVITASASGILSLPERNAERVRALQQADQRLQDQVDAIVTYVQAQAVFTCALASQVSQSTQELGACQEIQGVLILPPEPRGDQ